MTIKRRLIISNILIFVIPIITVIVMFAGISIAMYGSLDGFITTPSEMSFMPIAHGSSAPPRSIMIEQSASGQYILIVDEYFNQYLAYRIEQGGTHITIDILNYTQAQAIERMAGETSIILILVFLALLLLVVLINHIFTKFVFKPMIASLEILADGVQKISDGNLDYRIKQDIGNEFDSVCADFNEMAVRLHDMVSQKQLDEKSRKELIAGISHDLRTPLTAIKTYTEGIELGMASTPQKQAKYLFTIKDKVNDIEHIINQLFLFSRLDIGEFPMSVKQENAGRWIETFVANIKDEYAQKGLAVELDESIQGVSFLVDSIQLKNVFTNILENSVKYGNKNNSIIRIMCTKNNENIVISLTDNGSGVPSDSLDMLFDVFYRTDKARSKISQGSGLGLAISAKMIERMGGKIGATNVVGGGLSIMIALPIVQGGQ